MLLNSDLTVFQPLMPSMRTWKTWCDETLRNLFRRVLEMAIWDVCRRLRRPKIFEIRKWNGVSSVWLDLLVFRWATGPVEERVLLTRQNSGEPLTDQLLPTYYQSTPYAQHLGQPHLFRLPGVDSLQWPHTEAAQSQRAIAYIKSSKDCRAKGKQIQSALTCLTDVLLSTYSY